MATALGISLLAACAPVSPPLDRGGESSLAGTAWTIAAIDGQPVTSARQTGMRFSDDRISGNAGCNSFGGGYTIANGVMTATGLISTKMACLGPSMAQESAVFKILGQPMTIAEEDGSLTLRNPAGAITLRRDDTATSP